MGDTHFLLRHAIVGAIFLLFGWIGWWVFDPLDAWNFLMAQVAKGTSAALTAAVSSPIFGITIQGVHILWVHRKRGAFFDDEGRKLFAAKMKVVFRACRAKTKLPDAVWQRLTDAPADSLFVWLYHRSAPVDLIEWARRRRSYYYLGINLYVAALSGFATGAAATVVEYIPRSAQAVLVFIAASAWCYGARAAARMMRRDVDRMELLWVAARVDRRLKAALEKMFGTVIDETFSGSDPTRRARS